MGKASPGEPLQNPEPSNSTPPAGKLPPGTRIDGILVGIVLFCLVLLLMIIFIPAESAVGADLLSRLAWPPAFGYGHAVVRSRRGVAGCDRRVATDLATAPDHPR